MLYSNYAFTLHSTWYSMQQKYSLYETELFLSEDLSSNVVNLALCLIILPRFTGGKAYLKCFQSNYIVDKL